MQEVHQSVYSQSPTKDTIACRLRAWSRMGRVNTLFWFLLGFPLHISCTKKKNPVQQDEFHDV